MKYDLGTERQLIETRGDNMMRTWKDGRVQNRERRLRLNVFAPEVGLLDMLEHHGIRAKEAIAIKNGAELHPSVGLLRARLQKRLAMSGYDKLFLEVLDQMLPLIATDGFSLRIFVGCFCKDADGPVLWSRFGQQGYGYMLVFKPDFYIRRDVAGDYPYLLGSVTYTDECKLHQFDEVVDLGASVLHAIENQVEHSLTGEHLKLFASHVASEAALRLVLMKPKKLDDEREWRLAYSQFGESPFPIQHFETGEPYVRLPLVTADAPTDARLPITGVVLGKYAKRSEDEVRAHLIEQGYNLPQASVYRSDVEPHDPSVGV